LSSAASASLFAGSGLLPWRAFAADRTIIDQQPWGRLEELAEGVWAVVSTPLESKDWTTGCNGGLIAGKERVLAVESFVQPAGAEWLARHARELTGHWPTDVLITHFHGDHANGLEGYSAADLPKVWTTRTTLDLIRDEDAQKESPPSEKRQVMLDSSSLIETEMPTRIDLGGRVVTLHPRKGHTPSDVTVEMGEPSIVFSGDLVWNGLFPNYRDTEAQAFTQSIRALRRERETVYISGHGALANGRDVDTLLTLVESVEAAARQAHKKGTPLADAAAGFQMPAATADWILFNPTYFEVAFRAWYQELE
jgi:glyoxylase-like metal-dependent hydrolase (beta-lactamase superfamily II)